MNKVDLHKLSHNELLARCAWCHRKIPEDSEVFGAGTSIQPEFKAMLKPYEGKMFPMPLQIGREIIAGVPTFDSPAHKDGRDLYFQVCSEKCCEELTAAVNAEIKGKKS